MERFMQYWDDLDDLLGMIGLVSERIRNLLGVSAFILVALAAQAGGILLALRHPPMASAAATMLAFILLYHLATSDKTLK